MRPAVFAMEPMKAEHERLARILPSTLDVAAARETLFEATMDLGRAVDGLTKLQCQRADVVADSLSLLYYPFWLKRSGPAAEAWDGVTGNPEPVSTPEAMPERVETAVFDDVKVVEARCKSCLEPLPPGNRAVVFPCHSCGTFWVAEREDLTPFHASYAQPLLPAPDGRLIWLPFWRVEAEVEYRGRTARAAADVRTVLGVLGSRSEGPTSPPDSPLAYYAPAYGAMRAPKLDSTARDMTRLQPLLEPGRFARGQALNCFFGPEDAERLAYVVVLQVMPGSTPGLVSSLRVRPVRVDLWYVPFADEGREVRNLLTGLRYDRDSLRGVGH
jgi:hypothetical protein